MESLFQKAKYGALVGIFLLSFGNPAEAKPTRAVTIAAWTCMAALPLFSGGQTPIKKEAPPVKIEVQDFDARMRSLESLPDAEQEARLREWAREDAFHVEADGKIKQPKPILKEGEVPPPAPSRWKSAATHVYHQAFTSPKYAIIFALIAANNAWSSYKVLRKGRELSKALKESEDALRALKLAPINNFAEHLKPISKELLSALGDLRKSLTSLSDDEKKALRTLVNDSDSPLVKLSSKATLDHLERMLSETEAKEKESGTSPAIPVDVALERVRVVLEDKLIPLLSSVGLNLETSPLRIEVSPLKDLSLNKDGNARALEIYALLRQKTRETAAQLKTLELELRASQPERNWSRWRRWSLAALTYPLRFLVWPAVGVGFVGTIDGIEHDARIQENVQDSGAEDANLLLADAQLRDIKHYLAMAIDLWGDTKELTVIPFPLPRNARANAAGEDPALLQTSLLVLKSLLQEAEEKEKNRQLLAHASEHPEKAELKPHDLKLDPYSQNRRFYEIFFSRLIAKSPEASGFSEPKKARILSGLADKAMQYSERPAE